ncbi:MAG: class II fructose-bisphosphate aldolase [Oscillospiraceae bacterium]|nr:class II fructose-bisphosphate aldolase [Oscillospiraceae bacterium]
MLVTLQDIIARAEKEAFCIPAFNVYNTETAMGVFAAAEEAKAPVILQVYPRLINDPVGFYLAPAVIKGAEGASVPVCFHLDHGPTESEVLKSLRWGASGIMIDGSTHEFAENVALTRHIVEICAAGSVAPGHTTVKLATAGRICVITRDRVNADFMFNYRHVVPGLWYPGTGTASCAASYRWYRDALGNQPYEDLNRGAEQIPVGSDGLMFHPYLNGELTPYLDSKLRGSYTGISSLHTAAHFTRATLEGVAMSLRDCLEALHGLGVKPGRTRIIGGGAKGTLWRQIVADTLDLEMEKAKVDDSSFGSALLAAVGIGWFSDYAQAAETCIELDSVTAPNPENRAIYNDLFPRYRAIHDALAPIYHGMY